MTTMQHHAVFLPTIERLQDELAHTRVARPDMIFHYVAQSIDAEYGHTIGPFRDDAKAVIRRVIYEGATPAAAVRDTYADRWPPRFIGRVHLSDLRNAVVFSIYRTFGQMIDTAHMPLTRPPGPSARAEAYRNVAHGRPHVVHPADTERIVELLRCMHVARLAGTLLRGEAPADPVEVYNTCVGSWLHRYETRGMTQIVHDLFKDVYEYDLLA